MKARNVLMALDKAGMIKRSSIASGKHLKANAARILEGTICPQKSYLYSFEGISYIGHSALIITNASEKIYLYEI